MVFSTALVSQVILATAVLAIPSSSERMSKRMERRGKTFEHKGRPVEFVQEKDLATVSNSSHVEYSSNWAGAVWDTYPSGTFTAVTGTFVVPTPKSSGSGGSQSASAWVGIDGDTCGTAILQTGVDFNVDGGEVSYDAWYEWYPDYAYDFSGISISAGDEIKLTVTASTTKKGSAVIENVTTGQTVTKSLTSTAALCEENAEWIVEDFEEGDSLVPFANFGTVKFTNAEATTKSGSVTPAGATLIDIQQNSKVLTSSSTSGSTVTVSYV